MSFEQPLTGESQPADELNLIASSTATLAEEGRRLRKFACLVDQLRIRRSVHLHNKRRKFSLSLRRNVALLVLDNRLI